MGNHTPLLLIDPAIEKWAAMKESGAKNVRFTRRNLFCFFLSTVVVPVCIWNLSEVYATHYDYEPAGVQSGPSFKKRLPKE